MATVRSIQTVKFCIENSKLFVVRTRLKIQCRKVRIYVCRMYNIFKAPAVQELLFPSMPTSHQYSAIFVQFSWAVSHFNSLFFIFFIRRSFQFYRRNEWWGGLRLWLVFNRRSHYLSGNGGIRLHRRYVSFGGWTVCGPLRVSRWFSKMGDDFLFVNLLLLQNDRYFILQLKPCKYTHMYILEKTVFGLKWNNKIYIDSIGTLHLI